MPISSPSEAGSLKFISSIYPICGLKDIPSGVYLSPAAVLFFTMSMKSLYHSSSRVPRRVFPQEESPHRVRVSDHFGSLARVHLHFACSNHCILKNCVAFPSNMGHYAIEKFKHMHSCVNFTRPYPRQRRIISFNISTASLLQLLLTAFRIDIPTEVYYVTRW